MALSRLLSLTDYNSAPHLAVPENFKWIVKLNPMSYLIDGYRNIFYNKTMPDFTGLTKAFIMGIILCLIGFLIFKKLEKRFAEEL